VASTRGERALASIRSLLASEGLRRWGPAVLAPSKRLRWLRAHAAPAIAGLYGDAADGEPMRGALNLFFDPLHAHSQNLPALSRALGHAHSLLCTPTPCRTRGMAATTSPPPRR
jgi:hypothetical protein